jgi:sugar phosphate isomerase/epimerase
MYQLRLGASIHFLNERFDEKIDEAKALGFDSVDFDISGQWSANYKKPFQPAIQKVIDSGLFLNAIHLSSGGGDWDVSELDDKKRNENIQFIKNVIKQLDPYNPNCYILHGSGDFVFDDIRDKKIKATIDSLNELVSFTKTKICLENLPRTCVGNTAKEINFILSKVPNLYACIDTNHFVREYPEQGILAVGAKIATLHISDHDFFDEKHWMPKEGQIDWNKVLKALESVGYSGIFNYEIRDSAEKLYDIKQNYELLFAEYNEHISKD